jgi:hypothetical protein
MRKRTLTVLAAAIALAAIAACGGGTPAGADLAVGSKCKPFDVYDASGPKKGEKLCYV